MNQALTKRDLATQGLDALDPSKAGQSTISRSAGGVSFANAMEVMEFAKLMAVADKAVPKHLRLNAGACLRIVFQAVEWQMSPWSVADKSYEVNDRIAYESQLIHAVVEARAPLKKRLEVFYLGEGAERQCRIVGTFDDGEVRDYTSPKFKDIRVKNSPLWVADPDQQLFYYSSRAWSRRWCPDVIMGLYTKDELAEDPTLGRPEEDAAPGLHARLVGGNVSRDEGHGAPDAEEAVAEPRAAAASEPPPPASEEKTTKSARRKKADKAAAAEPAAAEEEEGKVEQAIPKTVDQWAVYASAWIKVGTDWQGMRAKWMSERNLRNACGVTSETRAPVEKFLNDRCRELGEDMEG